jgi:hypothetical protein
MPEALKSFLLNVDAVDEMTDVLVAVLLRAHK